MQAALIVIFIISAIICFICGLIGIIECQTEHRKIKKLNKEIAFLKQEIEKIKAL